MLNRLWISLFLISSFLFVYAQTGQVRGFIYNKDNGDPIMGVMLQIPETRMGDFSDEKGFYNISGLASGNYTLRATALGYDTAEFKMTIKNNDLITHNFYLRSTSVEIEAVNVTAFQQRKRKEIIISQTTIRPKQLSRIPTVGGEPDLVQYLQVLPGVVFSGDQGGQLYIRGGSPVMNRVMLDGMTIYNPFHSIGLFSVFDSDILKSVDVYSAGFSSEYGGRISAILDIKTRDGNKNKTTGKINASPFNAKLLLEGPTRKYIPGESSSSYILSYKNSYLDRSAPIFYPYVDGGDLPYSFSDLYAKWSLNSSNGSYLNVFGFDFNDAVRFSTTEYLWDARGLGTKFLLVPGSSKTLVDGTINYSDYLIEQKESDNKPRKSGINGYNVTLNFTNFLRTDDELKYGLEMNAFRTDFEIYNSLDRRISQFENTTEISAYLNYRTVIRKRTILETGFRIQRYASLQENSPEPRLRVKYLINDHIRFKAAAGLYSQNLMSAVSDRDVVNLFYGFLSGPDNLPKEFDGNPVTSKLQKARHAVGGFEIDINTKLELNIETYIKDFTQITNVNRDKIFDNNNMNTDKPDFLKQDYIIENGKAYGYDLTLKYEDGQAYVWFVYSYNNVSRFDGIRNYQPHFDRRHNINLVTSYDFGKDKQWSVNARWNFGSGFPFTQTQGFYELLNFSDGAATNYTTDNGELGILYANINQGRLPYYHRLDMSLKRSLKIKKKSAEAGYNAMDIILSATNMYNRPNIFYFDRVNYQRIDQLPLLPSISMSYMF